MDIILTAIASVLMIVGFFVICRTSDEDEEYEDEYEDEETSETEDNRESKPE